MNAVEAGLRFVFAVAGQVEGEDSECVWRLSGGRRDLNVLLQRDIHNKVNSNIYQKSEMVLGNEADYNLVNYEKQINTHPLINMYY